MPRKALRGLSGIKVFELLENTEESYKVGELISIPYAQKLTRDVQTSNDPIYADDEVYDDEEVFDGENFELEIPEADLKLMEVFEGGKLNEETGEYSWGPDDQGKDYAMTFKAKRKDGKYRMFRYYRAKFKKVKQDLQTQDNGTQVSVLTISGTFYKRALLSDPKVRVYKDSKDASDLAWLNTVPTFPEIQDPEITNLTISVVENITTATTAGTKVADLSAEGGTSPYLYNLEEQGDFESFEIDEATVKAKVDLIEAKSMNITVTATDSRGKTKQETATIEVVTGE